MSAGVQPLAYLCSLRTYPKIAGDCLILRSLRSKMSLSPSLYAPPYRQSLEFIR